MGGIKVKRKGRGVIYFALAVILLLSTLVRAYGDYGTGNASSDGSPDVQVTTVRPEYLKDQIIVKFKDNISPNDKKIIKKYYKLIDKAKFASGGEVLKLKGNRTVEELVDVLGALNSVEYAGFDYIMRALELPNASEYSQLWGMDKIDAPEAWEIDQGNPEVIVAVIDTGADMDHVDLVANIWTNLGEIPGNGIDDDGNGYTDDVHGYDFHNNDGDPSDDQGHGTHCAGTIAAEANDVGVVGVAPNIIIMPLKFLDSEGSGSFSNAVLAIDYAEEMGAHVISASWGGYTYTIDTSMTNAIDDFSGVFVAASGNDNINLDTYTLWGILPIYHAPASYPNESIVSVASIDLGGDLSSFSNYGMITVDLVSPGRNILSTIPDDTYGTKSGTSMATPHVAGVVALMISHEINLNGYYERGNMQLIDDLFDATVYDSRYSSIVKTGGCLNAYEALLLTPDYGTTPPPVNNPPEPITGDPPGIEGEVQVGTELAANPGGWTDEAVGSLTYTYEWRISTAESETGFYKNDFGPAYTPVTGEENSYIRIIVTATDNGSLTGTAESDWYLIGEEPPTTNDPPVNTSQPTLIDLYGAEAVVEVGNWILADPGVWEDEDDPLIELNYYNEWQLATSASEGDIIDRLLDSSGLGITLGSEDAEKYLRVEVTAEDTEGLKDVAYSVWHQIGPVNEPPEYTELPGIDGIVQVNNLLEFIPGTWTDDDGEGNLIYYHRWQVSATQSEENVDDVGNVDDMTYTPGESDEGLYLRVAETSTDSGQYIVKSTTAHSAWIEIQPEPKPNEAPANDSNDLPKIIGIVQVDYTVVAYEGTWTDDGGEGNLSYSYMWQISDTENGLYADMGDIDTEYLLESDEATKYLRLKVTATDKGDPVLSINAYSQGYYIEPATPTPVEYLTIDSTSPANGATGVRNYVTIKINFNNYVGTFNEDLIRDNADFPINRIATKRDTLLIYAGGLTGKTTYTLTIAKNAVMGIGGEMMADDLALTFTTRKIKQ
jgi:subtilisin family serine protease